MITQATINDLPVIYQLFEEAIEYQRKNNFTGWKNYDRAFLRLDVESGQLYKILSKRKPMHYTSTALLPTARLTKGLYSDWY